MSKTRAGKILSDEHKANISAATTGEKNPMFGRTNRNHPQWGKFGEKSANWGKGKPVICLDDGEKFATGTRIIDKYGGHATNLYQHLKGKSKTFKGRRFAYYTEEEIKVK